MIFLVQFGINNTHKFFQRPQIALALRARAILLAFEKNLLALIYSKLHSKSLDYPLMVFTLRHSRHVGGRKQKISN